ncbi:MAG: LamG-like jellyroll fold domain-containing protein [Verrucomicrobiia bacterium]
MCAINSARGAPPTCYGATISLSADYSYFIGSGTFVDASGEAESGSLFCWLTNGVPLAGGPVAEDLLLHFDGTANGVNGETPTLAQNLSYATGKWGSCLALPAGGRLQFSKTNNLQLDQGTIEMWVALRADGTNPVYSTRDHVLFQYRSPNGDFMQIDQSGSSQILYAGGNVNGQWESAYSSLGGMSGWKAGDWHCLAFTYSSALSIMSFYVDGVLTASNNEGHYLAPDAGGGSFAIGGDVYGNDADYLIDELRISGRMADAAEIAARARRTDAPQPNEVWLAVTNAPTGAQLVFEFTPVSVTQTGAVCQSSALAWNGIPITNPQPPSTLLAVGATSVSLAVQTASNTTCAYAVGEALPFAQMTPFNSGAGSPQQSTVIGGLNPDPNFVNEVYVRCAAHPDFLLHLQYRALSEANPPYPRTGNLWGWWLWFTNGLPYMSKVDLWLGASPTADQCAALRQLNPHLRILTSINAVENSGLPDDYYLKDIHGNRIEVWPGSYRLNLTKPYVADYQAQFAYQTVLGTGLMADGVFFDNVMTSQSWLTADIYGNPVQIDANEDGIPDDPATLDAAWKAGVFRELQTFRQLMPNAIISSHSTDIDQPGIAGLFNGISIGFHTSDVLEGRMAFSTLFATYNNWLSLAVQPPVTMIESSPMAQISYGYGYSPLTTIPPSTLEFARTYYPYVRFGLALTLLNDGFFAHEFGDTYHGNNWWYDELDFNLGYPLGPAQLVSLPGPTATNLIVNGGFENPLSESWSWDAAAGCTAAFSQQTTNAAVGDACARIDVSQTTGIDWNIELAQYNRSLIQGVSYDDTFWARADTNRYISVSSQKGSPNWDNYGLYQQVWISTNWQQYTVSFTASATVSDARLQFFVGAGTGTVWLDEVHLTQSPPQIFRRDFNYGSVLLNATRQVQNINVGSGFHRLTGTQAPMYEWIIDDLDPAFATIGTWTNLVYDSGLWKATGPYYHSWAGSLHQQVSPGGEADWQLSIPADDTYTISAWWPAAPQASNWTSQASFQVVAGGIVVASTNVDQTTGGDQWHDLATVQLCGTNVTYVRLTTPQGVCVADALHVRSLSRYNNGQPAPTVRLQPMDGIVLQSDQPTFVSPLFGSVSFFPDHLSLTVTNLTPGLSCSLQKSSNLTSHGWQTIQSFQTMGFSTNLQDNLAPDHGNAFYRIQIN